MPRSPVHGCVFAFSFRLFALLVGLARPLACLPPTCAACRLFVSHLLVCLLVCFPLALCVRTHAQKLSLVLHERALRRLLVLHRLMQLCAARASKHRHGSAAACALPAAHVPPLRESRGRGMARRGWDTVSHGTGIDTYRSVRRVQPIFEPERPARRLVVQPHARALDLRPTRARLRDRHDAEQCGCGWRSGRPPRETEAALPRTLRPAPEGATLNERSGSGDSPLDCALVCCVSYAACCML